MNPELNREKASLKHGYWFYFEDEGAQIIAHGSALSGKETVFIDGAVASTQRSFCRKTTHNIHFNGHNYQLVFFMESILKGTLHCSLYKDGELVSATNKSYTTKTFAWKTFFASMAVGAVFGYCAVWLFHRLS